MEVKYTNFKVDSDIYPKGKICGLIDRTGNFLYETFYDVKKIAYNANMPVFLYLSLGSKNKKLVEAMKNEFEIRKELLKRPLKHLSESELLKILIIKLMTNDSKTIILDHVDSILNSGDLKTIFKMIKNNLSEVDKTVIFVTNKIDNIVSFTDRYIIADNGSIIYNGNDLNTLPIETSCVAFTRAAKKRGANLDYYKDVNDLLKAVYRNLK